MSASDAELRALIAQAQAGDVRAFEALVAGHHAQVRRFARAFAHTEADADDLAQEALVKLYRNLRSYRFQSAFSTWLYTVVRNAVVDAARSRAGKERAVEDPLPRAHERTPADSEPADEALVHAEEQRRVWQALRQLPPDFRAALVLFDVEGYSYEEVAKIEGVAMGTIKSRLSRGRALLRELLGDLASSAETEPGTFPEQFPSKLRQGGGR